ncbi:MAG: hypothetical protein KatS3mg015_2774 [Fimbriimonadales bacterium]|nr:MAG: hypothetical protein KatS3mg015_2774 [Fimbriimonadales bacterium]
MAREVYFQVLDSSGNPLTGDSANLSMFVVKDGSVGWATNSPVEVSATNLPGWYRLTLTDTELAGNSILVSGVSSTGGARVGGVMIYNQQIDATTSLRDVASQTKTNLDVAVSTRLASSDSRLNNLDVAVGTRLASTDSRLVRLGEYPTSVTYVSGGAADGKISTVTWSSGKVWTYHYDANGRLTSISEA